MPEHDPYLIVGRRASSTSAMVTYMLDVIAFFFAGRFSWMLRMFPERSTAIIIHGHISM